jgi:soluble lytic murein transglycosylase-like protein
MILLITLLLAGFLLSRPAAAQLRTTLQNALTGTVLTGRNLLDDAAWYTYLTARAILWACAGYVGLLLLAHLIGNSALWLTVLVLGVIFSVTAAWVLQTLRYPMAEIGQRLLELGNFIARTPLLPQLPDWANPDKVSGAEKVSALIAGAIYSMVSAIWLPVSAPILGLGGVVRGLGRLAPLAAQTCRWLARCFATVSLTLLFLTVVSLVDFRFGTSLLDTWTLILLGLLAVLGISLGLLATSRLEATSRIPAAAVFAGTLTGLMLLGLLWAHLDPRGSLEMVRSFRNAGDNLRTYARIGNDAAQITNKGYWRLRAPTVLRPCANCMVSNGQLNGAVGKPVEYPAGQALISLANEQPVDLDGVYWMRVFLPYDGKRPELGYNLKPGSAWLAPKDFLEGAAKPVDLKPTAPPVAVWSGLKAAGLAISPLLLVLIAPAMLGLSILLIAGIGNRAFNSRPKVAAPTSSSSVAGAANHSGHQNHNEHNGGLGLGWLIIGLVLFGPWVAFIVLNGLAIVVQSDHFRNVDWTGPSMRAGISSLLAITASWLVVAAIVLAFTKKKGVAIAMLLVAMILVMARSVVAENVVRLLPRPAATLAIRTNTVAAAIMPAIPRADFAANLAILDEELARYPELFANRDMILALIKNESDWDPNAKNPKSSAAGLMQLISATQAQYGVANPFDPRQSIQGGLAFLADLHQRYNGEWPKMLLAYAWGPENVPPQQSFEALMAAADAASPESSAAVRRVLGLTGR